MIITTVINGHIRLLEAWFSGLSVLGILAIIGMCLYLMIKHDD